MDEGWAIWKRGEREREKILGEKCWDERGVGGGGGELIWTQKPSKEFKN